MKQKTLKLALLFLFTGFIAFSNENTKCCKMADAVKCAESTTAISTNTRELPDNSNAPSAIISTPGYCLIIIN